jgi:hypothetical protein
VWVWVGVSVNHHFIDPHLSTRRRNDPFPFHDDFTKHPSKTQNNTHSRTSDDYFLGSGDKIRFFWEVRLAYQQRLSHDHHHVSNSHPPPVPLTSHTDQPEITPHTDTHTHT